MILETEGVGLRRKIAEALSGACDNSTDINSSYHNLALQGVIAVAGREMGKLPRVCSGQNCPFSSCSLKDPLSSDDKKTMIEAGKRQGTTSFLH